ncbi:toxin protein [Escherichia coli]|uniref:anthrax toxin-like adenylyl cyclase domain-containing protein n=1 Tax=Escherichia coli TaxID=562 RepID=UPI00090788A2|nr:anthrax toxin-like adenylyl cyclase domain-containing protein [Escherichia coli]EEU9451544.1 toxin protein [Escherichia coli]EEW3194796.1 toxin protein [Escherichia coli]EFK8287376.1 toxin protein [Escherichia coli]EFK8681151.1 toxin protein [Escherichia coli]EFN7698882.1 toxin protein [Escherichia coli]
MNVTFLYVDAFKRVSSKYKVALGLREPNPLGETLLREGYPSKNFHMKAKSSSTGPTAGFITEKVIYSKVPTTEYIKQNNLLAFAIQKGAKAIDLTISKSRINELIKTGNLTAHEEGRYSAVYPSGRQFFIIKRDGKVFDDKLNPVRVMSNPKEFGVEYADPRPVTADYDLFSIIPRVNQSINYRPLTVRPKLLKGDFKCGFLKPDVLAGKDEDANMGNVHFFGKTIIDALNKEITYEGYRGGKLVWHNDETGNPFSPGFNIADKPIFVHPTGSVIQIHSLNALLDFYEQLRREGYAPEYSSIFGF